MTGRDERLYYDEKSRSMYFYLEEEQDCATNVVVVVKAMVYSNEMK